MHHVDEVPAYIKERAMCKQSEKLTLDSSWNSLGLDSLETIQIAMELEEEFDVNISDERWREIISKNPSVREIIVAVRKMINQF